MHTNKKTTKLAKNLAFQSVQYIRRLDIKMVFLLRLETVFPISTNKSFIIKNLFSPMTIRMYLSRNFHLLW